MATHHFVQRRSTFLLENTKAVHQTVYEYNNHAIIVIGKRIIVAIKLNATNYPIVH